MVYGIMDEEVGLMVDKVIRHWYNTKPMSCVKSMRLATI